MRYQAFSIGLKVVKVASAMYLKVYSNSQLAISQVAYTKWAVTPNMETYQAITQDLISQSIVMNMSKVGYLENKKADKLIKLASYRDTVKDLIVQLEMLLAQTIN
ncbi:hypothetical protein SLA2020_200310 [Shorea laevis]